MSCISMYTKSSSSGTLLIASLNSSRSSRIAWLLEELGVNYEVRKYERTAEYTAPEELKKIYPLGLAPVLQIFKPGREEPVTLAESGHIVLYMIRHYDVDNKLLGDNEEEQELVNYYLHFAEGSVQPHLVSLLINHIACEKTPWPFQFFSKALTGKINSSYYLRRLQTNLKFLEDRLAKNPSGYFVGEHLTAADIIFDFPINENLIESERLAGFDLEKGFPHLYKWNQLTSKIPARLAAIQKTS